MELENYCWVFKSVLTPKFCDDLIEHSKTKEELLGWTGNHKPHSTNIKAIKDLKKTRDSNIIWMDGSWIYREIHPYINQANKDANWNFEWDYSEACQFTKYQLNQHYTWHVDSWKKPYKAPNELEKHNKIRKLSVTCQLTDGSEYEGGELEFDFRDYSPNKRDESKHIIQAKEILPKGSIIVFPSNSWHRVKPVTKGTRYSLVLWNLGYPFK